MNALKNLNNKKKGKFTLKTGCEIYKDGDCNQVLFSASEVNKFVSRSVSERKKRNGLCNFKPTTTVRLIGENWTYSTKWE